MTDIQELRRLAQAATQGEWSSDQTRVYLPRLSGGFDLRQAPNATENAAYIAAANPAAILELLDRLEKAEKDAARLDWLQEQSYKAPGLGWVARDSTTGRGYRLHQDAEGAVLVRVAIDKAMEASK